MESSKLTLTITETAKLLGISRCKAYEAARLGNLPVIKFGRRLVVPIYALEKMLREAGTYPKPIASTNQ